MSETIIATFVIFVVVIDPIGTAPLFAALTAEASASDRRRIALRGVAIATGVLIAFALGGAGAASKTLRVAQATRCGLLLAARRPPDAMTRLSLVRNPGSPEHHAAD